MHRRWARKREIAAARRGQIIQRILVDGWSPAEAAFIGVEERRVARWVAAYRRQGMASLRAERTVEDMPRRCVLWLQLRLGRLVAMARGEYSAIEPAPCVILRRTGDDRRQPR